MRPTAKSLILDLLSVAGGLAFPVRKLTVACALFDISENSVRVTLVRLSAAGLIEAAGRGAYRLGESAVEFASEVSSWRTAETRVRPWNGDYVAVHGGAPVSDRVGRKRGQRALQMLGFRELTRGLSVRPDNLEGGVESVRARLHTLGLESEASVFRASAFDPALEAHARDLWDGKELAASYKRSRARLAAWLERAPGLELDVQAREAFLLGGSAIRQLVYDPLLPAPLVDVDERRAFVESVRKMDKAGRAIWKRFLGLGLGSAVPSTVQLTDENPPPGGWIQ
ncbi:PaaX family transcriptional regulator C-terminal domain-containing protein [Pendulispora rubella]|uniref:PaaX family transcriptional regulator C-terminal domain-containing protein n=1 Tax=Pendulispora rubella TaxID=2741070 RepID=UPI00374E12E0